jgi:hypothetical protein
MVGANAGHILPAVLGMAIALVVVVVGLLLSRNKSAGTAQPPDEPAPQPPAQGEPGQPPPPDSGVSRGRSPLWGLILPGVGVLLLGGAIFTWVIPLFQDISTAHDNFRSAVHPPSFPITVPNLPYAPPPVPLPPPQINIPHFQPTIPPPPKIPQTYVDGRGIIHTR